MREAELALGREHPRACIPRGGLYGRKVPGSRHDENAPWSPLPGQVRTKTWDKAEPLWGMVDEVDRGSGGSTDIDWDH